MYLLTLIIIRRRSTDEEPYNPRTTSWLVHADPQQRLVHQRYCVTVSAG